jgi:hypothetical protein
MVLSISPAPRSLLPKSTGCSRNCDTAVKSMVDEPMSMISAVSTSMSCEMCNSPASRNDRNAARDSAMISTPDSPACLNSAAYLPRTSGGHAVGQPTMNCVRGASPICAVSRRSRNSSDANSSIGLRTASSSSRWLLKRRAR